MSAPELSNVELAMHDVLRRAITVAVANDTSKSYAFSKLSEGEKIEVRRRLVTLSNLHTAVRDGDEHPHELVDISRLRGWFLEYVEQLMAPTHPATHPALESCQVVNPLARHAYDCEHYESGGLVCEASGDRAWHEHKISEHTQLHDERGNGYSCEAIDAMLIKRRDEQDGATR